MEVELNSRVRKVGGLKDPEGNPHIFWIILILLVTVIGKQRLTSLQHPTTTSTFIPGSSTRR